MSLLLQYRVECKELPLSEAKYPSKFTTQTNITRRLYPNATEDEIQEYIKKYEEYQNALEKIKDLERRTFTRLGELVDYLSTLDRNLLLIGNGADIGGYDVSTQPHVYVNHDKFDVSFSNLEYDLYHMREKGVDTSDLAKKVNYDKDSSIISGAIYYSYKLLNGATDNSILIIQTNNVTNEVSTNTLLVESKLWEIASDVLNLPYGVDIDNYDMQEKLRDIFNGKTWNFN